MQVGQRLGQRLIWQKKFGMTNILKYRSKAPYMVCTVPYMVFFRHNEGKIL